MGVEEASFDTSTQVLREAARCTCLLGTRLPLRVKNGDVLTSA
jgi:hypothetical protein